LETLIFDVHATEADGLELAQDAGAFVGFATQTPPAREAAADQRIFADRGLAVLELK
jgi:hypothetical protein